MTLVFHILQWIVSIIGVFALCYILHNVLLALYDLLRKERSVRYAILIFVGCGVLAATFQRVRIGFWDWPDVDYKIQDAEENPTTE